MLHTLRTFFGGGAVQGKPPAPLPALATIELVPDWTPPDVRPVPAERHVSALLSMASTAGVQGYVRSKDIVRYYAESCWMHGYKPLADHQILCEVGFTLERRRIRIDGRQLTHYFMPPPGASNVVPLRKRKTKRKPSSKGRAAARRALARKTASALAA